MIKKIFNIALDKSVKWPKRTNETKQGLTFLLTLPSDLPCMAYLSLKYLSKINLKDFKILISLDSAKDFVTKPLENSEFNLDVIKPKFIPKNLAKISGSPFKFHWLQIVSGLKNSETEWVLLKGCNLFMNESDFYSKYIKQAMKSEAYFYGIIKRPDHKELIVGTYELLINTKILNYLKPIDFLAKDVEGKQFDNVLYAQHLIKKRLGNNKVMMYKGNTQRVHFSYLLGMYRKAIKKNYDVDPYLRIWILAFFNQLLIGSIWYRKDFMSLNEYYKTYFPISDSARLDGFKKDLLNVVKYTDLDLIKARKLIQELINRLKNPWDGAAVI